MTGRIAPVILAGGAGTRLWPLSRPECPKQFIPGLAGRKTSLFDAALRRIADAGLFAPPLILCNAAHEALVAAELRRAAIAPGATVLVEPEGRNTAPALAAAVHRLAREGRETVLAMLPADHCVSGGGLFAQALRRAAHAAAGGRLALLGIEPASPNPAYGYIRRGGRLGGPDSAFAVREFIEKPGPARAAGLVAGGDCYWNSGIIVAAAGLLAEELARHAPLVWESAGRALREGEASQGRHCLEASAWRAAPAISADRALLEKTQCAAVSPADFGWSDMGAWESLWSAPAFEWTAGGGSVDRATSAASVTNIAGLAVVQIRLSGGARMMLGEAAGGRRYLVADASARLRREGGDIPVTANEPVPVPDGAWRLESVASGALRALLFRLREPEGPDAA